MNNLSSRQDVVLEIKRVVEDYLKGHLLLKDLCQVTEHLIDTLSDKVLHKKLIGLWWLLEEYNASVLNEDRTSLTESEQKIVNGCLGEVIEVCKKDLQETTPPEPEDPYAWPFEEYK